MSAVPRQTNRDHTHQSDETIATKAAYALNEAGLKVIFCIGELPDEHEAGNTLELCVRQLSALNNAISDWTNVVIAYGPVRAFGTGKVATPDHGEEFIAIQCIHPNAIDHRCSMASAFRAFKPWLRMWKLHGYMNNPR